MPQSPSDSYQYDDSEGDEDKEEDVDYGGN